MEEEARLAHIKAKLEEDPLAVDLQWSLMHAALSSYKHDSLLRPFPSMFTTEGSDFKDYARMEKTMGKCPNFVKLRSYLQHCAATNQTPKVDGQLSELLYWLTKSRHFQLKTCDKEKFSLITALTGQEMPVTPPNYVFEVHYNDASNEKFEERRGDKDFLYAVHGSRVENFHSILLNGLQGHMSKNALFGEGIYLSAELSVSMPYAPTGSGWDKSSLGDRLSCFAVCQIIDDERFVKCTEKDPAPSTNSNGQGMPRNTSRARIAGAEGGDIPEKYYVVRNNEFLRVKYLLVYAEQSKSKKAPETWMHWFKEHKFIVMLVVYILLLICVGLYSSPTFHYRIKRLFKKR